MSGDRGVRPGRLMASACAGMFVFGIVMAVLGAILPALFDRIAFSKGQAGSLFLVMNMAMLLMSLVFGPVVDRSGFKIFLIVCALAVSAALVMFLGAGAYGGLLAAAAILGLGGGGLNGGTNALVSDVFPDRRGAALNTVGIFFGFGALAIPFLIGALLGWAGLAPILAAAAALALVPAVLFSANRFPAAKHAQGFPMRRAAAIAGHPALWLCAFLLFFQSANEFTMGGWLSTHLHESFGMTATAAAMALAGYWAAMMSGRLLTARLSRRFSGATLVFAGAALSVAAAALVALARSAPAAAAGAVLTGLGFAAIYPTTLAVAGDLFPEFTGTAFSVIFAVALVGGMLSPWLAGRVAEADGVRTAMLIPVGNAVMVLLLHAALSATARRRKAVGVLVFAALCLAAGARAGQRPAAASPAADEVAAKAEALLRKDHPQLLMEKGVVDSRGVEIDSRLAALIRDARARGARSAADAVAVVLSALNYSPSNLGGFPPCAFDRPFGEKLVRFGRTVAATDMDASAEGNACPVGGFGAGGFERTISGNARYWFLRPGWTVDETVWADQFHVFMRSGGTTIARTLSADAPPDGALSSWAWRQPAGKGDYYALYPKSGFSFEDDPSLPLKIAVTQFSPVIPGNYRETSYPVAVYKWIARNPTAQPVEGSVLLTWENMVGWEARPKTPARAADGRWDRSGRGRRNELAERGPVKAVVFRQDGVDPRAGSSLSGTMCIAAEEVPGRTRVTRLADFDPKGDGAAVWAGFSRDGVLSEASTSRVGGPGDELAGALAVSFSLGPGERIEFPVVIAWDFPYVEFEPGVRYRRKHTDVFGMDGGNAAAIAGEALSRWREWEGAIDAWQASILSEPYLPDWLKQALFNELYQVAETGVWDAATGLFSYLESSDYLMFGTFDVDSYCWHVLRLWPDLERRNVDFFSGAVAASDPAYKAYQYAQVFPQEVPPDKLGYYWNVNKVPGMVPHDLGSPRKRPWVVLNAFDWQNGNVWKDLNPKFPLRALRAAREAGGDLDFLDRAFGASVLALDTLDARFGGPPSHLPRNEGIPDQTYDTWRMRGESAYVGMLWLASLEAARAMGADLLAAGRTRAGGRDVREAMDRYAGWLASGRAALEALWNEGGGYYNIDSRTDDIMTDQLFGPWYAAMLGLEGGGAAPVVPPDREARALRTIYQKNVLGFGRGEMGAVNGRTAAGGQLFSQQGDEVWAGTTYAFASNCILHGLAAEGLQAAYGVYHIVFSPYGQGYAFRTPEAYLDPEEPRWNDRAVKNGDRLFRAMKYMRPGAVWAVREALRKTAAARGAR